MLKIDCISDLHGSFPKLEGGDLLIVAGDLTARDQHHEYISFYMKLMHQNYSKKIFIGGNHDNEIEKRYVKFDVNSQVEYLCDSGTEFEGLKIWGSPWSKTFPGMNPLCKAFTVGTEAELNEKWALIPDDIDILITHSPPFGILDECSNGRVGSIGLRARVLSHERFPRLKLHVFGHIHECGGKIFETTFTKFVNASVLNERYQLVNSAVRVEI